MTFFSLREIYKSMVVTSKINQWSPKKIEINISLVKKNQLQISGIHLFGLVWI